MSDGSSKLEFPLPEPVFAILVQAAQHLSKGRSVSILHYAELLTTQQAADLLGVSRPYLIGLLQKEVIPFEMVGTHRRIRMEDLLRYKEAREQNRRDNLKELRDMSEDLGLYEPRDI